MPHYSPEDLPQWIREHIATLPEALTGTDTLGPLDLLQPRLCIFDWDGTLAVPASGAKFPKHPYDYQPLPGRITRIQELQADGVKLAIATNQGGAAFGIHSYREISEAIVAFAVGWFGIRVVTICPHHPKGKPETGYAYVCECRKPQPGMLVTHMRRFEVPPEQTLFVGDMDTDEQAAHNAGCAYCDAGTFFAL